MRLRRKKMKAEIKAKKRKMKKLKKKDSELVDIDRYGPYFNYLPFEKAVIITQGKFPVNNHEVELITNRNASIKDDAKSPNNNYFSPNRNMDAMSSHSNISRTKFLGSKSGVRAVSGMSSPRAGQPTNNVDGGEFRLKIQNYPEVAEVNDSLSSFNE